MNTKSKIDHIASFMYDYVKSANASGLVTGISGGIDSAVASAIMKIAYPDNSLGVILPIKSQAEDFILANKLAKTIKLETVNFDLSELHDKLFNAVVKEIAPPKNALKLADANLRARLRMSTIYLIGGLLNYLVVGTDNKAELYTGYFTKYGDGGCDILPLSKLSKAEVYELARYLNLPNEIIERPPSAGLWQGQTDESEMGVSYDEIDAYLRNEIISAKSKEIIENMHRKTEHKRNTPVECPEFK